jgi:hypothetical protein
MRAEMRAQPREWIAFAPFESRRKRAKNIFATERLLQERDDAEFRRATRGVRIGDAGHEHDFRPQSRPQRFAHRKPIRRREYDVDEGNVRIVDRRRIERLEAGSGRDDDAPVVLEPGRHQTEHLWRVVCNEYPGDCGLIRFAASYDYCRQVRRPYPGTHPALKERTSVLVSRGLGGPSATWAARVWNSNVTLHSRALLDDGRGVRAGVIT